MNLKKYHIVSFIYYLPRFEISTIKSFKMLLIFILIILSGSQINACYNKQVKTHELGLLQLYLYQFHHGFLTISTYTFENPLQYSSWEIPWTEEPGGLQSMALQKSDMNDTKWTLNQDHQQCILMLVTTPNFF